MTTFIKTTYTKLRGNGHIMLIVLINKTKNLDKLHINLGAKSSKGFQVPLCTQVLVLLNKVESWGK